VERRSLQPPKDSSQFVSTVHTNSIPPKWISGEDFEPKRREERCVPSNLLLWNPAFPLVLPFIPSWRRIHAVP